MAPLVDHIVMRRSSSVPQLQSCFEQVTNGENAEPLGPGQPLGGDAFPAVTSYFGEHRKPEVAVDRGDFLGGGSEHLTSESPAADHEFRVGRKRFTFSRSFLCHPSSPL